MRARVAAGLVLMGMLLAAGPLGAEEQPDVADAELKPLVEEFHEGSIDWQTGAYYATVKVPYQAKLGGRELSPAYQKVIAERVAKVEADKVFVILASKIRVDADRTIKDIATDSARIRLYGNVVGRETVKLNHVAGALVATFKVDMRGVGSVTSKLYKVVAKASEPKTPEGTGGRPKIEVAEGRRQPGKPEPVVVIDARGTGCQPAVFPKILDEDGHVIYDATVPPEEKVIENGVATYAVAEAGDAAFLRGRDGIILVEAVARSLPSVIQCAEADEQPEAEPAKRRRRRRVPIKASEVGGKLKTDIVVSKDEAAKLKAGDAGSALSNARVIVVTDTTVGGTEGRLLPNVSEVYAAMIGHGGR